VTPSMLSGPAPDGAPYKYTCTYSIPGVDTYTTFTPGFLGGMTWQADAIDPVRGYLYVCAIAGAAQAFKVNPRGGAPLMAGRFLAATSGWSGSVAAINLRDNRTVWLNKWMDGQTCFSGIVATAGGVIFTADNRSTGPSKVFAFDSASGQELWSYQVSQPIAAAPITYAVRGRQYVAFMGGGQVPLVGGVSPPFQREDRIYVFALRTGTRPTQAGAGAAASSGPAPSASAPPARPSGNADGRNVFIANCGSCHTFKPAATTGTSGPDLGIFGPLSAAAVADVVMRGTAGPTGTMPSFSGRLTSDQIQQVAAFVSEATRQ
jgi:quinohemoprotein ethanol dehydrogenase